MNIYGIGTDIVRVDRIQEMMDKHPGTFLKRVYTKGEIEYCSGRKAEAQHFAGRWAAKEAILKVFGSCWSNGIQWTDIDIHNEMGGKPTVRLAGAARELCEQRGITQVLITISHTSDNAIAFATAMSHSDGQDSDID